MLECPFLEIALAEERHRHVIASTRATGFSFRVPLPRSCSMAAQHPYLDALRATLPDSDKADVENLCQSVQQRYALEVVLAFVLGAAHPQPPADTSRASDDGSWKQQQAYFMNTISGKPVPASITATKRALEDDTETHGDASQTAKKAKLDTEPEKPVFLLHTVSATAPIRKKVEAVATKSYFQLIPLDPKSTLVPCALPPAVSIPLASITRVFLIPTRGKTKSSWTVVMLTSDTPPIVEKGKGKPTAAATGDQLREIVFSIEAEATGPIQPMEFLANGSRCDVVPKGKSTLHALEELLKHIPVQAVRPSAAIFRGTAVTSSTKSRPAASATSSTSTDGQADVLAGVDAHRGAKSGSLWFLESGLLWTDVRPAEFWSLEDILPQPDGIRVISPTGRTCSVYVTRKVPRATSSNSAEAEQDEDEDESMEDGVETEFALIDGKEQDAIHGWIKRFGSRFGRSPEAIAQSSTSETAGPSKTDKGKGKASAPAGAADPAAGPVTILSRSWEGEDDSDDDFQGSSSDSDVGDAEEDGESAGSNDSDDSDAGSDQEEEDGSGEGSDDDAQGSDDDEEEELDPAHHPLLRPGAMPKRVSKAVIDMVAGMVTDDMLGGQEADQLDEEDELDE
jgi:hypothetical protein